MHPMQPNQPKPNHMLFQAGQPILPNTPIPIIMNPTNPTDASNIEELVDGELGDKFGGKFVNFFIL